MKKIIKNKILLFLVTSLICFAIAIIISFFSTYKNNETLSADFEKTLHKKEKKLENVLINANNNIQNNIEYKDFDLSYYRNLFLKDGIVIIVYENDSLKFWSDNSVPFEHVNNAEIIDNNVNILGNGWYFSREICTDNICIIGLVLIKSNFQYQNQYLENKFQNDFNISDETLIYLQEDDYNVLSSSGKFLLSLVFDPDTQINESRVLLILVFYIVGLMLLSSCLLLTHKKFNIYNNSNTLYVLLFIVDLIIIRSIVFYFEIPRILYSSKLFKPDFYASSELLPSLGDLLLNTIVVLIISFVIYKEFSGKFLEKVKNKYTLIKSIKLVVLFSILFAVFNIMVDVYTGLIINSDLSFNLNNIFGISLYSGIGFFIVATLLLSFFLISLVIFHKTYSLSSGARDFFIHLILALIANAFICYKFFELDLIFLSFPFALLAILWFFRKKKIAKFSLSEIFVYLLFFSVLSTYILNSNNTYKEKEKRKSLAMKLSVDQDPLAESLYQDFEESILKDNDLIDSLKYYPFCDQERIISNIMDYFETNDYWKRKYNFQITICDDKEKLIVANESCNCFDFFFNDIMAKYGKHTFSRNFLYINRGSEQISYLGVLRFFEDSVDPKPLNIFIEIDSKSRIKGYTELLTESNSGVGLGVNYSYARYFNGNLQDWSGKYFYNIKLKSYGDELNKDEPFFISLHGYSHLFYKNNDKKSIIISKENDTLMEYIAPFSYLFIFFTFYILLFISMVKFPFNFGNLKMTFKNRIQVSIIFIILISFLFTGVFAISFLQQRNIESHSEILNEKTHSVLIEIEHKLADTKEFTPELTDYLSGLLIKFSNVFFSDINLYDLNGQLIASSRKKIFKEGLISDSMNPLAFRRLKYNKKTFFINNENIGNLKYLSAYVPFRNSDNYVVAYLNLPYFAKQNELENSLSTFLTAFINIYFLLIGFAIFMAITVSNYISKPLILIKNSIARLHLGKSNEKINWEREDEIGDLINQYNRMVDELIESAELLARSERESAWREMAKQVAHEIKNPLTPMKLSVQYLEKAWKDNAPDWENRLERFSKTLIEQIDALSDIASEFSDFAKMPKTNKEKIELSPIVLNSIDLFKDYQNIQIFYKPEANENYLLLADKKQLLRVFNNLLKNSVQAIGDEDEGVICIEIISHDNHYLIKVMDNGSGIPDETADKIFSPNFTTKTSGMGLGLAMVKNIITYSGGRIWFESQAGKGTTFFISLPIHNEERNN